jgi:hypothetical protein
LSKVENSQLQIFFQLQNFFPTENLCRPSQSHSAKFSFRGKISCVEIGLNKRKKRKTGNGMLGNVKHVIIRYGPWCGVVWYGTV